VQKAILMLITLKFAATWMINYTARYSDFHSLRLNYATPWL